MTAIIYQLPDESINIFKGYDEKKFDFPKYKKVYEWDIDDEAIECADDSELLEDIFYIFNCKHPSDFKGRSLSVSDVVMLGDNYYYCDIVGWQNVSKEIF